MATFTLYEYQTVTPRGDPMAPPAIRSTGLAFDAARRLAANTVYFRVIPDVDAYMAVNTDGSAATSADEKVFAAVGSGYAVDPRARPYVYLTAA